MADTIIIVKETIAVATITDAGGSIVVEVTETPNVTNVTLTEQGMAGSDGLDGGGLDAVVNDPSPTLGGDLLLDAYNIIGQLENEDFILDGGLL